MEQTVLAGNPPVDIGVRRTARARRITLSVSRCGGQVTLTLPERVALAEGLDFARAREDWIRAQLACSAAVRRVELGVVLPVEGRGRLVEGAAQRAPRLEADRILVRAAGPAGPQAAACLKLHARDRLVASVRRHAARLGRPHGRITLRDTRSRWGSCSSKGDLMFSWRLILAPPPVLDYVAAHEVAHLERMDHSRAFWTAVEGLCPGWRVERKWLRRHGADLMAYRFDG